MRELTLFPAGRHDDQVDSTAQALAWIKSRPRAHGMAEHWRRMAEEGAGRRVGAVRLIRRRAKRQRAALWGDPARLGKP